MIKLYKYRPLTDFLFKELYYCELYFASYYELNDPLDLSTRIDFRPINEQQIEYLIYFLVKTSIKTSIELFLKNDSELEKEYINKITEFHKDKELIKKICNRLYNDLIDYDSNKEFISYDIVEQYIKEISKEFNVEFRLAEIKGSVK